MFLNDMIEQCTSDSDRWFPGKAQELANLTLCMCGEAGEVANLVKKVVRGSVSIEDARPFLAEEIVDVLIYLCNLMGSKDFESIDWKQIWDEKRKFNEERFS
jgi:NTP pyrophosphatase (non-canonical NTP hydrolase)